MDMKNCIADINNYKNTEFLQETKRLISKYKVDIEEIKSIEQKDYAIQLNNNYYNHLTLKETNRHNEIIEKEKNRHNEVMKDKEIELKRLDLEMLKLSK
jgi:hypothetical protein